MTKSCLQCGSSIEKKKNYSQSRYEKLMYCSNSCAAKNKTHYKGSDNASWKGGKVEKKCIVCDKTFHVWLYRENAKCCSKTCADQSPEMKEALRNYRLGNSLSEETKEKIRQAVTGKNIGETNPSWKGDDVGYRAIHDWIRREKGTPDECEHCGLTGSESKKRLVWANKSHEYKRDVNDWMRLCYPCHRKYDFPNEKHPN